MRVTTTYLCVVTVVLVAVLGTELKVDAGPVTQSKVPSILYDVIPTYRSQCVEDILASPTLLRTWSEMLRHW